jgi:hypothetical protein
VSPAFLILWGPGLFRLTCYYYRKAYYRSFWLLPPRARCRTPPALHGETRFPLIMQTLHRYAWYVAVVFIVLLTWDALLAFRFNGRASDRGRDARDVGERHLPGRLHVLLPLLPACLRRLRELVLKGAWRHAVWRVITTLNERTRSSRGSPSSASD